VEIVGSKQAIDLGLDPVVTWYFMRILVIHCLFFWGCQSSPNPKIVDIDCTNKMLDLIQCFVGAAEYRKSNSVVKGVEIQFLPAINPIAEISWQLTAVVKEVHHVVQSKLSDPQRVSVL
jgi:hypothetical protein